MLVEAIMYHEIQLKTIYRTKMDDVDNLLIIPLLRNAKKYDRGTGYFSIVSLADLAKGIIPFLRNNGHDAKMRIVTSVELPPEEQAIINRGERLALEVTKEYLWKIVDIAVKEEEVVINLDLITNLIAAGVIEIKIGSNNKKMA